MKFISASSHLLEADFFCRSHWNYGRHAVEVHRLAMVATEIGRYHARMF